MLTREDIDQLTRGFAPAIRDHIAKAQSAMDAKISVMVARLDALERRFNEMPSPLPGRDGRDADPAMVLRMVGRAGECAWPISVMPNSGSGGMVGRTPSGGPPECPRTHHRMRGRSASMSGHGSLPPPDKTVRAGNLRSSNPGFKVGRFGHMFPAWLQRPPAVPDAALVEGDRVVVAVDAAWHPAREGTEVAPHRAA